MFSNSKSAKIVALNWLVLVVFYNMI